MRPINYGFIGFGNMAKAIVKGLQNDPYISFKYISQSNKHTEIESVDSLEQLINQSDVIVLCIKPQELLSILDSIKVFDRANKLILSPVAGKSTVYIESVLGKNAEIIRIMPNLAVEFKKSVTSLYSNSSSTLARRVIADMEQLGKVVELSEDDFDLFTAIFGSGPAFILQILDAMKSKISEIKGIDYEIIDDLLLDLTLGTATYLQENHNKKNLAELICNITSKGGTTEAGLRKFKSNNLHDLLGEVIDAAKNRSKELSDNKQ